MSDELKKIQREVFLRRPVLQEILKLHGTETLLNYVQNSWQVPKNPPSSVFLKVLDGKLTTIYGEKIAKLACEQLTVKPLVSTVDHLGIWNHPIFVNSSLIYSMHFEQQEFAVVLATESVSLNNTSSWSGSLLMHNEANSVVRHSFFKDSQKTLPVFSTPRIANLEIENFNKKTNNEFIDFLKTIEFEEKLSGEEFGNQACKISYNLWNTIFPEAPKLVYLPLETLISEFLLEELKNSESIFYKFLVLPKGRDIWKKYFVNEHTFLFWGIDEKGRRLSLKNLTNDLEELLSLIKNRKIYPSSPLCFAVLLYAGLSAVGGFTQTTWLTEVKAKYEKIVLELIGDKIDLRNLSTKNFAESSLAWLELNGWLINPTALDLFFYGKNMYDKYNSLAGHITLEESINLAMPTIYSVVVPKLEQDRSLNLLALEKDLALKYKIQDLLQN